MRFRLLITAILVDLTSSFRMINCHTRVSKETRSTSQRRAVAENDDVDIDNLKFLLKEFKLTPEQEKAARAARQKDGDERTQTIKNLENEYWSQLSPMEREAETKLIEGLLNVKQGAYAEAVVAYDRALVLKPRAYAWQRGVALYCLGRFRDAAEHLEKDAALFALRFEVSLRLDKFIGDLHFLLFIPLFRIFPQWSCYGRLLRGLNWVS